MAGPVSGAPGKTYPNRSDLNAQPVRAASGQPYGQRGQQEAMQRAQPLPGPRGLPTPLSAPSARPQENISAGMPFGEGPDAPQMLPPVQANRTLDKLRALYLAWPDEGLRELIQRAEETGR